ncbi:hypothetical protein CLOM_g22580 [Closterium sp. NIES-68]|nr:hypothetical protein CLOM_g22580 [Closterium sp. NIES-68]GJP77428.1 hypothetical protein CLOP_g7823 [Closterium sp. NIES-67]
MAPRAASSLQPVHRGGPFVKPAPLAANPSQNVATAHSSSGGFLPPASDSRPTIVPAKAVEAMAVAWARDVDWKGAPVVQEKCDGSLQQPAAAITPQNWPKSAGKSQLFRNSAVSLQALEPVAGDSRHPWPLLAQSQRRNCGSPSERPGASSLSPARLLFATPGAGSSQPVRVPELTAASGPFATTVGRMPCSSHPPSSLDGAKIRSSPGYAATRELRTCEGNAASVTATQQQHLPGLIGQHQFQNSQVSQEFLRGSPRVRGFPDAVARRTNDSRSWLSDSEILAMQLSNSGRQNQFGQVAEKLLDSDMARGDTIEGDGREGDLSRGIFLRKRSFMRSMTTGTGDGWKGERLIKGEVGENGWETECPLKSAKTTPTAHRAVAQDDPFPSSDTDVAEMTQDDDVALQLQLYLLRRRQRQQLRLLMEERQAEQQPAPLAELAMVENEMLATQQLLGRQAQLQQRQQQQLRDQQQLQQLQQQMLQEKQQQQMRQLQEQQQRQQQQQHQQQEQQQQELRQHQQQQEQEHQQRQQTLEDEITRMIQQQQQQQQPQLSNQQQWCPSQRQRQQQPLLGHAQATHPARDARGALEALMLHASAPATRPGPLVRPSATTQVPPTGLGFTQEQRAVAAAVGVRDGEKRAGKGSAAKSSSSNPAAILEALFEKSFKERNRKSGAGNSCNGRESGSRTVGSPVEQVAGQHQGQDLYQACRQRTPPRISSCAALSGVPNGVPGMSSQLETFRLLSAALSACEPLDPALYTCQHLDEPYLDMPLQELEALESLLMSPRATYSDHKGAPAVLAMDPPGRSESHPSQASASASAYLGKVGAVAASPAVAVAAGSAGGAVSVATSAASGASMSAASAPPSTMPVLQAWHSSHSSSQSCLADGGAVTASLTHPASVFPSRPG